MCNPSCSDFGDGIWMWYVLHGEIDDAPRHYTDCRTRVICGANLTGINRSCVSVLWNNMSPHVECAPMDRPVFYTFLGQIQRRHLSVFFLNKTKYNRNIT